MPSFEKHFNKGTSSEMTFSMMALKSFRELSAPLCGRCLLIGFLASQAVTAQVSGGVFRGEVRDASNAVVQQAKIQVQSVESGAQVVMESNGDGLYSTPTLVPGSYTLTATKDSFKEIVFGPVTLQVNQIVRVDFALAVGVRT